MRIRYISDSLIPSTRANSINVMNTCASLAEKNNNVTLYAPKYSSGEKNINEIFNFYGLDQDFDLKFIYIPPLLGRYYFYSIVIALKVFFLREELIISRNLFALNFLSFFKKKLILDLHTPLWQVSKIKKIFFNNLVKRNRSYFSFNSNSLLNIFKSKFTNYDFGKLIYAPNGAKAILGVGEGKKVSPDKLKIGYFGSYGKGRGLKLILELANFFQKIDFLVVGVSKNDLEDKNVPSNIKFYGKIEPSQVPIMRSECDILLAPYEKEVIMESGVNTVDYMSPIKVFEYMASNKAIILSDLPALREILDETEAVFVKVDDINQWIKAITFFSEDENRMTFANNAYNRFKNDFTWEMRASRLLAKLN